MDTTATHSNEHKHDGAGSWLLAPLRWLRKKVSGAVRWVAKLLRKTLRPALRLMSRWPFRAIIGALLRPREQRGFGFWWPIAMIAIAGALGLLVAVLLTPVAGILAALVVGIWAIVSRLSGRRAEAKRDEQRRKAEPSAGASETPRTPSRGAPIATAPATG